MQPLPPEALEAIHARAYAAQTTAKGTWPTDLDELHRLLRLSTASREFVAHARRDVLALVAEVRRLKAVEG